VLSRQTHFLTRSPEHPVERSDQPEPSCELLGGVDAVVHVAADLVVGTVDVDRYVQGVVAHRQQDPAGAPRRAPWQPPDVPPGI